MPTPISARYYQWDGQSNAFDLTYFFPKSWGFAVESITPAETPSGTPATTCDDALDPTAVNQPRAVARAEILSYWQGLKFRFGSARTQRTYGLRQTANDNSLYFLRWIPATQTAELCLYLFSDEFTANPREFLAKVNLTRVSDGGDFDWTLHVDLGSLFGQWSYDNSLSVIQNGIHFNDYSVGNWTRDAYGQVRKVAFSRAPSSPETAAMGVRYRVCRQGRSDPQLGGSFCKGNDVLTVEQRATINVTPPPTPGLYFPGRITAIGTPIPGAFAQSGPKQPSGFGLVTGRSSAPVTWSKPLGSTPVKGYVLAIAKPNNPDSLAGQYLVTQRYLLDGQGKVVDDAEGQPVLNPAFDSRTPCGEDGTAEACSFDFPLPATGKGGVILTGDGKYDAALITIYFNGYRTDGRCDNGTIEGAMCDPRLPAFQVFAPGISIWQFVMRLEKWPARFASADGVPRFVLLVDYTQHKAELIKWGANTIRIDGAWVSGNKIAIPSFGYFGSVPPNAKDTDGESFYGRSTTIEGTDQSGTVSFGNFKPDGSARSFQFIGTTAPLGSGSVPLVGTPASAVGTFHLYYPNNWTIGADRVCITAQCAPVDYVDAFQGRAL